MVDPYSLLELPWGASADSIKRAFRRLALHYHPDRNPGDSASEARFKLISAAYQRLKESEWSIPRPTGRTEDDASSAHEQSNVRPEYWARIHYPTAEEIDALLRNLGAPTLLGRLRSAGLWLTTAFAYLYVTALAVALLVFLVAMVARLLGR